MAVGMRRDLFRRTHRHHLSAAAFRSQVHDPVGGLDHVYVAFDHHDGIASIPQFAQHFQQLFDVVEVQAGGMNLSSSGSRE